jgi:hypothetical protein
MHLVLACFISYESGNESGTDRKTPAIHILILFYPTLF